MTTILIAEDDELLLDALTGQLRQLGHEVCSARRWKDAAKELERQAVDGIILDLGLPGGDGLNLLSWARERFPGLPVLILTARDGVDDRVRGLNAGADDYMTKPFNMDELHARLHSMLRRARLPAYTLATADPGRHTSIGGLQLDHQKQKASLANDTLELTQREWELLELLVNRSGEVVTREDVLASWRALPQELGQAVAPLNSNALEVYVHRLRKKLEPSSLKIRNIRGLGYMLEKPAA
jgi:DNA-binding response OmpR family regulator